MYLHVAIARVVSTYISTSVCAAVAVLGSTV
jgi:hypothetical protein